MEDLGRGMGESLELAGLIQLFGSNKYGGILMSIASVLPDKARCLLLKASEARGGLALLQGSRLS